MFDDIRDAEDALRDLDGTMLYGRELQMQFADGNRKSELNVYRSTTYMHCCHSETDLLCWCFLHDGSSGWCSLSFKGLVLTLSRLVIDGCTRECRGCYTSPILLYHSVTSAVFSDHLVNFKILTGFFSTKIAASFQDNQ